MPRALILHCQHYWEVTSPHRLIQMRQRGGKPLEESVRGGIWGSSYDLRVGIGLRIVELSSAPLEPTQSNEQPNQPI